MPETPETPETAGSSARPEVSPPEAVFWDLDGTLVDSEPVWGVALDEAARRLGRPLTPEVRQDMTGTDDRTTMRILARHTGVAASDAELDRIHDGVVARVAELLGGGVEVLPGAREVLRRIRAAGLPMALVTSSPRGIAEIALGVLGAGLFDVVVTAGDVAQRKPDPEPYLLAARKIGVAPERAWAVEDSPSGGASAQAAGCAVLLAPGALPAAHGPRRTALGALTDLLRWIEAPHARGGA